MFTVPTTNRLRRDRVTTVSVGCTRQWWSDSRRTDGNTLSPDSIAERTSAKYRST